MSTIVSYYGNQNGSSCGYCKQKDKSLSHGMWVHTMHVQDYQDLIDRGWRRSGSYCYKPTNEKTCCPSYTIKCDALKFKPSKSERKIIKRFNRFILDGNRDKMDIDCSLPGTSNINLKSNTESSEKLKAENSLQSKSEDSNTKIVKPGLGADLSKPKCKKAKLLRLEKKKEKLMKFSTNDEKNNAMKQQVNKEKSLEDLLNEIPNNGVHKFHIKLLSSSKNLIDSEIETYRKYQIEIHNDKPEKLTQTSFERFLVTTPLKIKTILVNDNDDINDNDEYNLYKKYQTIIHNDPPNHIDELLNFLKESPLESCKIETPNTIKHYGSYHQQYWLDNELIAVGVIDILPSCLSSVYFFYNPDYNFLTLGTYGALREIAFVRQVQKILINFKYYYMGFYIHSCPKMRYKAKISESSLLCSEVYTWHKITDDLLTKLNENKYQRFNNNLFMVDENQYNTNDLSGITVLHKQRLMTYERYLSLKPNLKRDDTEVTNVLEYGTLVGKKCATNILLYLE